jgi:succinate dehydrogenase / fumarate reductase cytochrome b subunit
MPEEAAVNESTQAESGAPTHACKHHFEIQPAKPTCKCQKLLWPRRIHALLGLALTCFLVIHLSLCMTGLNPVFYQSLVERVERTLSHLPGLVLIAIMIPLMAQACSGIFLLKKEGLKYVKKCNRGGELRYFLQRISALVILAFAAIHVGTLHQRGLHLLYQVTHWNALARYSTGGLFHAGSAFQSTVVGIQQPWTAGGPQSLMNIGIMFFSLLGVLATAYHVANGAWSGGIVWKIAGTRVSKPIWACFSLLLGIVLALSGSVAWYAFTFAAHARTVTSFVGR